MVLSPLCQGERACRCPVAWCSLESPGTAKQWLRDFLPSLLVFDERIDCLSCDSSVVSLVFAESDLGCIQIVVFIHCCSNS